MRANIYVLFEVRSTSFDLYMACGSQQEALDYYRKVTGRPGQISETQDHDGHAVVVLDQDREGAAYINQYKVGITEPLND